MRVELLHPVLDNGIGQEIIHEVQTGRSSLQFLFGDKERRRKLFIGNVAHNRVIVAVSGEKLVGYALFSTRSGGPYNPKASRFSEVYGLWAGPLKYILFKITEPRVNQGEFYLYRIVVKQKYRSRGVGKALLSKLNEIATQSNCLEISLDVIGENTRAIQFYYREGFQVTRKRNLSLCGNLLPFKSVWRMSKRL